MGDVSHLWLFFLFVLGIISLPGMDMAFIAANALAGGRRRGLIALGGIATGGMCHTAMAALGVGLILQAAPLAFDALLVAGAAYLTHIGWALMRRPGTTAVPDAGAPARGGIVVYGQGLTTCLLNPKAYVFSLSVFPQFIRDDGTGIAPQAAVMGAIIALTQLGVYGTIVLMTGPMRCWFASHGAAQVWLCRFTGALLIGGALWGVAHAWR